MNSGTIAMLTRVSRHSNDSIIVSTATSATTFDIRLTIVPVTAPLGADDVVVQARHDLACLRVCEEAQGHRLQMREKLGTQSKDDPLADGGAKIPLEGRQAIR